MSFDFRPNDRRRNHDRQQRVMTPEQLEARLLLSTTSITSGSFPIVSNLATGTPVVLGNSATVTRSTDTADNFTITGTAATLSIQGVTSTTNVALTYAWTTTQAPVGGTISYAKNANNQAKDNTLKFTRAGSYVTRVSILSGRTVVSTLMLQLSVTQLPTRVGLLDSLNKPMNSGAVIKVTTAAPQLSAISIDQFNQPLVTQPEISWSVVTAPAGGSATLSATGNSLATVVSKAGTYTLKASSGTLVATVSFSVSQVLSTISLTTSNGTTVAGSEPLVTRTTTQALLVKGFDQFGNPMATLPSITWSTTAAPVGGAVTTRFSAGVATATFTRAGIYGIKGVAGGQVVNFRVSAEATLSRISVRTPENREVLSGGTVTVPGTNYQLAALGLDQFSQPLISQPEITWQTITAVTGGTATLNTDGNKVLVEINKAGAYSLRATSGSILSNVTLSVTQSLSSLTVSTPNGSAVEPSVPVVTRTTSQAIAVKAFDQFGNPMATLPSITWSTTAAPVGGAVTTRFSAGVATATFTRAGIYGIKGVAGGQVVNFRVSAEATLSRISVRTPENREVLSGGTVTVPGTNYQLAALGLDQFSQPLISQPEITWQTITAVTGGTATLNTDGNKVLVEINKAGAYSLRATSGSILSNVTLSVTQSLSSLTVSTPNGSAVEPSVPVVTRTTSQAIAVKAFDQFGNPMATLPSITWSTVLAPSGGTASTVFRSGVATVSFNRSGNYVVRAATGAFVVTAGFQVVPTLQSIAAFGSDGRQLSTSAITVGGSSSVVTLSGLDQFRVALAEQPSFTWSTATTPSGGEASFSNSGSIHTITFSKAGSYVLRAAVDALSLNLSFSVIQSLTSIALTPGNLTIAYGVTQQFLAKALDQFESPFTAQPAFVWSASGGTVSNTGFYTAGTQAGLYSISVRAGTFTKTLSITVIAPTPPDGLLDPDLAGLVNGYYGDGQIDRTEMMAILRSAGADGMVSATELADFRFLVSSNTPYLMPQYVRGLATDVVNASPANLRYKGQTAGNLSAGSASTLLNILVDKWFLGTDEPALTTAQLTYQTTTGNLFNGTPSRADARQGALGDCYFIAAVASIADRNPDAVRNMFVDNGDGTYTVRFYNASAGVADYVTVSRRLPAQYNGALGYSGYGLSVSSTSTTVWIALAEKAYAQWNETGNEGRDGTNRYAAIEGGWMGFVNAQVLGTASSNYSVNSTNKQTLITALNSQKAVTIGTYSSVSAGLYGSHAYLVTGYEASTDTFRLHNPWGVSHPGALSYSQLQAYCSMFVVADTSGSSPISGSVSGEISSPGLGLAGFASSRAEQNLSMVDLNAASAEQRVDYSIAQVVAESSVKSERRSDGVSPRVLTRLRINFMQDDSVASDLWDISLPKDHLTEMEFDLIDQLFAEQDEPVAV